MTFQNKYSATDSFYYKNDPLSEPKKYKFLDTLINSKGHYPKRE